MEKFITTSKGYKVFTRWYDGLDKPKAIVVLIHGIGEHIHRYNHWAELFNKEGVSLLGADLPGHGRSSGRRGHIGSFNDFYEVIDLLMDEARKKFPESPIFLYGHSMGGNIVLSYLVSRNPSLTGSVVTSPWLKLSSEPPKGKLILAGVVKSVFPGLVQDTGLVTEFISQDPEVVKRYKSDPLVHSKISVSLFLGARNAASSTLEHASELKTPTLILHGDSDKLCSPEGSRIFAARAAAAELIIWENGFHELHNEPFKEDVFATIINWISKRINEK